MEIFSGRTPEQQLAFILPSIVRNQQLHGLWLNSLSFMEHIGATKIACTQAGKNASFMVLKHASEEARHGFFLKKMARKVWPEVPDNFEAAALLAPVATRQYLFRLDASVSRMLRNHGFEGKAFRDLAYLLVTYAIEVRADSLYPVYQELLKDYPVKVSVLSIINEEEGHLEEMESALAQFDADTESLKDKAVKLETALFINWVAGLTRELQQQQVELSAATLN